MKKVKKTPRGVDFYFTIIDFIKRNSKLPEYTSLGLESKQSLEYYLKPLKIDGIIRKTGYGVWSVNEEKADQFKFVAKVKTSPVATPHNGKIFTSLKYRIRAHAFIISFEIPKIKNWERRKEWLSKKEIAFKPVGATYDAQSILFKKQKVWLCDRKIVIYQSSEKSYFSRSAEEGRKYAMYDFLQLMHGLENLFGLSFKINGKYKFKIGRQHYAKIKDELARQFNREGRKLEVYSDKGLWLLIDDSFKLEEMETVNKETAVPDMDKIVIPFYESLKDQFEISGETFRVDKVMQVVRGVADNQQLYAENIQSHISSIQQLGSSTEANTKTIAELAEVVKSLKSEMTKLINGKKP